MQRILFGFVVIGVLLFGCSSGGDSTESATRDSGGSGDSGVEVSSTVAPTVRAPGVEASSVELVAVDVGSLPPLPDGFVPVEGSFVDGDFPRGVTDRGPVTLTFDTGDEEGDYLLAHFNDLGEWEFQEVVSVDGTVEVVTNDFSIWGMVTGRLDSAWDGTVRWALDRTEPPEDCDATGGDGLDWIDTTGPPPVNLVHTCIRQLSDETAVLIVKSNTGWPVELIVPPTDFFGPVQLEGSSGVADLLLRPFLTGSDSYLLSPGREAFIEIRQPETGGASIQRDIWVLQSSGAAAFGAISEHLGLNIDFNNEIAFRVGECILARDYNILNEANNENPLEFFAECASDGLLDPRNIPDLADLWLDADFASVYEETRPDAHPYWDRGAFEQRAVAYQRHKRIADQAGKLVALFDLSVDAVQFGSVFATQVFEEDGNRMTVFLDAATAGQPPDDETVSPAGAVEPEDATACSEFSGQAVQATISGVAEWVNGRTEPSTLAEALAQIPANSEVLVFTENAVVEDDRRWFPVAVDGTSACMFVAGSFLKADGSLLARTTASAFVDRALRGLDAEAALGTMVPPDLFEPSEPIDPVYRAELESQVAALQSIGAANSDLVVVPDRSWIDTADDEGCYLSDTLSCEVLIQQTGRTIASVSVGSAGDGWDAISIEQFGFERTFSCQSAQDDGRIVIDAILTPERDSQFRALLDDYYVSVGGRENADSSQPIIFDTDGAFEASSQIIATFVAECASQVLDIHDYGYEVLGHVGVEGPSWRVLTSQLDQEIEAQR